MHFTEVHTIDIESVNFFDGVMYFAYLLQGIEFTGPDPNCISNFLGSVELFCTGISIVDKLGGPVV